VHSFASEAPTAEILITAFHDQQWQVRYDVAQPTRELVFARSPDNSRKLTWLPDELFEIVETDHGEAVRRKDGAAFTSLRIRMSAEPRALPNDYSPFERFGTGVLFHTGRFFVCPRACESDSTWSVSLWADPNDTIVLNGKMRSYFAQWQDSGEGRMVYIGGNQITPEQRNKVRERTTALTTK